MKLELGIILQDDDIILSHWDDSPLLPDSISHGWTKLARKLGIKASRLHTARHTHASLMIKQGTHVKVIQERLGHSTITVTMDIYGHTMLGLQKNAAEKFDEVLNMVDN